MVLKKKHIAFPDGSAEKVLAASAVCGPQLLENASVAAGTCMPAGMLILPASLLEPCRGRARTPERSREHQGGAGGHGKGEEILNHLRQCARRHDKRSVSILLILTTTLLP